MPAKASRAAFGEALLDLGARDERIVTLDADLSKSTMTVGFAKKYPGRAFNLGIAESNMIGVGAGLALTGRIPFVCSFACFVVGRFETIRISVAYTNANVKIVGTHAGIAIGEDGYSQMGLEDVACLRALPNVTIVQPADEVETKQVIAWAVEHQGPVYLRLTRQNLEPVSPDGYRFQLGRWATLRAGTDVTVIASGGTVFNALQAATRLEADGISAEVINAASIKPLDEDALVRSADAHPPRGHRRGPRDRRRARRRGGRGAGRAVPDAAQAAGRDRLRRVRRRQGALRQARPRPRRHPRQREEVRRPVGRERAEEAPLAGDPIPPALTGPRRSTRLAASVSHGRAPSTPARSAEERAMRTTRRTFLTTGTAAATVMLASRAFAQWQPSPRYPDPPVQIVDPSFAKYRLDLAKVERLATGLRWSEGPVWFGDGRYLLWSDIPNNRIMRWDEETGAVSVFRKPSNYANGNTRDRQGRLLTCEHDARRVTRTEYDGTITVIADRFDGKPLNSPNDIVCKSDGSIWFTDPPFGILGYYEGYIAKPELPTNVYRVDGKTGPAHGGDGRRRPARTAWRSRRTSRSSTSSRPASRRA